MGFTSKIWKDRKTEYPARRMLTKEDGSTELVTVARAEGSISEEGDAFSAENMNDLENRISDAVGELNSSLALDYSNSSVNDLNTFLQIALEKLCPKRTYIVENGSISNHNLHVASGDYTSLLSHDGCLEVVKSQGNNSAIETDSIDLTGYKTLTLDVQGLETVNNSLTYYFDLYVGSTQVITHYSEAGRSSVVIDVSAFNSNNVIKFNMQSNACIAIYNMYLE